MSGYTWGSLPPYLPSETVSWGQSVTQLLRTMGRISSIKRNNTQGAIIQSSHPHLPYQLFGSPVTSGWEITAEFGKLTPSASFLIRKMWRSPPAPKPTVTEARPNSSKPLAGKKLKGSLFLPPRLTYLCGTKIFIREHIGNYISILLARNMSATKSFINHQDLESP